MVETTAVLMVRWSMVGLWAELMANLRVGEMDAVMAHLKVHNAWSESSTAGWWVY